MENDGPLIKVRILDNRGDGFVGVGVIQLDDYWLSLVCRR